MCAPSVIDTVRRTVSRRQLLGAVGAATLGAACGGPPAEAPAGAQPEPQPQARTGMTSAAPGH